MLELDLEHMKAELFPEILAHAFEAEASHHRVQVVNSRLETVWDSRPGGPEFEADSVRPFFATRPPFAGSGPRLEPGITWHLRSSVTGGIDAAVARAQARNLFAGGGVVLLLAGTVALLLSSVRRAQKLTEREFEFVAQATHELRTPISVIRAAADNLADGVVREEAQVRRYGALVRDEGRRLSRLIEQVLQYGRVTRQPGMRPVALGELVAQALADREAAGGAASRMTVEVDVAPDLPSVVGDPEAIQLILRNLIENAAVHAASGEWMRMDAGSTRGSSIGAV
jgi:signal transduction histidine kinase